MTTYTTAEFAKAAMLTQEETETFKRGLAAFLGWTYFANKSIQDMLTMIEENGYIATIGEGGWPILCGRLLTRRRSILITLNAIDLYSTNVTSGKDENGKHF
jgi:hypothetical protein